MCRGMDLFFFENIKRVNWKSLEMHAILDEHSGLIPMFLYKTGVMIFAHKWGRNHFTKVYEHSDCPWRAIQNEAKNL